MDPRVLRIVFQVCSLIVLGTMTALFVGWAIEGQNLLTMVGVMGMPLFAVVGGTWVVAGVLLAAGALEEWVRSKI